MFNNRMEEGVMQSLHDNAYTEFRTISALLFFFPLSRIFPRPNAPFNPKLRSLHREYSIHPSGVSFHDGRSHRSQG